eukprot:4915679-Amphidinium_carterae.1
MGDRRNDGSEFAAFLLSSAGQDRCQEALKQARLAYRNIEVPAPGGRFPSWQYTTTPPPVSNEMDGGVREGLKVVGHAKRQHGSSKCPVLVELAFRGSTNQENWLANFKFELSECIVGRPSGRVHQGFQWCYLQLQEQILKWLKESCAFLQHSVGPEVEVHITGHSLGGAMATLAAYDLSTLGCVTSCVTWGSPKVGDSAFKEGYSRLVPKTARFTTTFDPVPRLPPDPADATGTDSDVIYTVIANLLHRSQEALQARGLQGLRTRRIRNIRVASLANGSSSSQ